MSEIPCDAYVQLYLSVQNILEVIEGTLEFGKKNRPIASVSIDLKFPTISKQDDISGMQYVREPS